MTLLLVGATAPCQAKASFDSNWPFGTRDFVQYWSACELIREGKNPYDSLQMFEKQKKANFPADEPVLTWNPPLLFPILCPFTNGSLSEAAKKMAAANLLLWLGAILFSAFAFKSNLASVLLAGVMFFPGWDALHSGQIGLLFAFSLAAHFALLSKRKDFFAGVVLFPLSIKPHLFLIFSAALLLCCVSGKRYKILLGSACGMAALGALSFLSHAGLWEFWWRALGAKPAIGTSILEWRPDALVGFVRALAGGTETWPLYVLPAAGLLALFALRPYWIRAWFDFLPAILCFSLAFAPYGWFSDQAALLPAQIALLKTGRPAQRLLLIVVFQLGLVLSVGASWWFPLALGASVALWGNRLHPGGGRPRASDSVG